MHTLFFDVKPLGAKKGKSDEKEGASRGEAATKCSKNEQKRNDPSALSKPENQIEKQKNQALGKSNASEGGGIRGQKPGI